MEAQKEKRLRKQSYLVVWEKILNLWTHRNEVRKF